MFWKLNVECRYCFYDDWVELRDSGLRDFFFFLVLYGDISEPKEDRECSPTNKRFDTSDKLLVVEP